MSLSSTLKSFAAFTLVAVFAFSIAIIPSTNALSGGVPAPSNNTTEANPEGKCANIAQQVDRRDCLKKLVQDQKNLCQQLKAKKETAKLKACNEALKKKNDRLKTVQGKLKEAARAKPHPKDYQECLVRVAPVDDTSNMRDKINATYKKQLATTQNLQKKVDKFANQDVKAAMTTALTTGQSSDVNVLKFYKEGSTKTDSPSALQAMYCQMIFRLQTNSFRKAQVNMLKNVDAQLKYDQAHNKLFTNSYNAPEKFNDNIFKNDINTRLNTARDLTTVNLKNVATAYMQTVGAKVEQTGEGKTLNFKSNLAAPQATINQAKKDRVTAKRNYDEAQVLRTLGNDRSLTGDRAYSISSITLKNGRGDVISPDGKVALSDKSLQTCQTKVDDADAPNKPATARKATAKELKDCREKLKKNTQPRQAIVVLKSGGKEYTKKLSRADKISVWKVRN